MKGKVAVIEIDRRALLDDAEQLVRAHTCKHCGKARADVKKRDYETGVLCYPCWAMAWEDDDNE